MSGDGLTAEWAEVGKRPDERGYRVQRCSDGPLSEDNFFEIYKRLSTGTPDRLPQVKIGFGGVADDARIVLAVEERGQADRDGRPVIETRIFCIPYAPLGERPTSYRALYDALRGIVPEAREPVRFTADPLVQTGPMETRPVSRATAALLLTKKPVSVIGAGPVSVEEKIDFIDEVAGHLPYGLRTKFNCATWASSTSQHKVRLTFSQHPRSDGHVVEWGQEPYVELSARADNYLRALAGLDEEQLMEYLASLGTPLTFAERNIDLLIGRLREKGMLTASPALGDASPTLAAVAAVAAVAGMPAAVERWDVLLQRYADALDANQADQAQEAARRIRAQAAHLPYEEEREACRRVIDDTRLLGRIDNELTARAVVAAAYQGSLNGKTMAQILEVVGKPTSAVVKALEDLADDEGWLMLRSDSERQLLVKDWNDVRLVFTAATATRMDTVTLIAEELARRHKKGDAGLAGLLTGHGFLAPKLHDLGAHSRRQQREILRTLLRAAHGPEIKDAATFKAVLRNEPTEMLLVALLSMYTGPYPRALTLDCFVVPRLLKLGEYDERLDANLHHAPPRRHAPWDKERHNLNGEPQAARDDAGQERKRRRISRLRNKDG